VTADSLTGRQTDGEIEKMGKFACAASAIPFSNIHRLLTQNNNSLVNGTVHVKIKATKGATIIACKVKAQNKA